MATYADKLKDPRWQKKRLEVMQRDDFTCQLCKDNTYTLNVHHKEYLTGRDPWDYPDEIFITLCEVCHSVAEDLKPVEAISVFKQRMRGDRQNSFFIIASALYKSKPTVIISEYNEETRSTRCDSAITYEHFLVIKEMFEKLYNG